MKWLAALPALVLIPVSSVAAESVPALRPAFGADLTPWMAPTMPPQCSSDKARSGDLAGCLLSMGGSPAERGLGEAPFPFPQAGAEIPWVDLGRGADGHVVLAVQKALAASGLSPVLDGQFGSTTQVAVKAYQTLAGLPATGVVDAATAQRLGVVNTEPGAFPPPGFRFNGWAYNGSPALATWDAMMIRNASSIGGIGAGRLVGHPDVMGLFEGFLRDVVQGGYTVRDAGVYAFRCTSNSRMNCAGVDPDALSNHAWGIAIDLNSGANPELTYAAPGDGTSACAVPVKTDYPQWAIQVAEKWGLYWGGYGYSRSCATPDTMRDSILRDATHFEYRGDVATARAIMLHNTGSVPASTRLCTDSAGDDGTIRSVCSDSRLPLPGWRLPVDVAAPAGATAALVNIAMTGARTAGFVTAEGCGAVTSAVRQWANGTFAPNVTVSNLSVVPLDSKGRFCLYANAAVHTVVDVQGFFVPAAKSGSAGFVAIEQRRVLDTRDAGTPAPGGSATALPTIAGVPAGATALLVNAAVTETSAAGYVAADRCSRLASGAPGSANVNFAARDTVSNLAVVPVSGDSGCLWSMVPTHLVVDAQGAFVPGSGLGFSLVGPKRLTDTRGCADHNGLERCGVAVGPGEMVRVTGARGSAAMVNLTLTEASGDLFAVADRCDVLAANRPLRANANTTAGRTVSNLAVVPVAGDGSFCVWVSGATHVIVDIQGVFEEKGALRFVTQDPQRRLDTRAL